MIFYPAWKTPWGNLSFVSTWLASSSLFFAYFLADISFLLLSSPWFFPSFLFCFSRWLSMFFSSLADEDKARSLSFDSLVPRLPHLHHHHYNPHFFFQPVVPLSSSFLQSFTIIAEIKVCLLSLQHHRFFLLQFYNLNHLDPWPPAPPSLPPFLPPPTYIHSRSLSILTTITPSSYPPLLPSFFSSSSSSSSARRLHNISLSTRLAVMNS